MLYSTFIPHTEFPLAQTGVLTLRMGGEYDPEAAVCVAGAKGPEVKREASLILTVMGFFSCVMITSH